MHCQRDFAELWRLSKVRLAIRIKYGKTIMKILLPTDTNIYFPMRAMNKYRIHLPLMCPIVHVGEPGREAVVSAARQYAVSCPILFSLMKDQGLQKSTGSCIIQRASINPLLWSCVSHHHDVEWLQMVLGIYRGRTLPILIIDRASHTPSAFKAARGVSGCFPPPLAGRHTEK